MSNYFNTLTLRQQLKQLSVCHFLHSSEFAVGVSKLLGKKIVIVGCGAQGLNQGLNMRDSGLDVSYALRPDAIEQQRASFLNATEHGFIASTYEDLIPQADIVVNLTPDKQHTSVVSAVMPLMKHGSTLSYSHGFNIVEEGMQIRDDITVIMVAPKSPGSEVREEYKRGFGVPTLIAVHPENDPQFQGLDLAKAYAVAIGSDKAGVLLSSFAAEVKSDLMGEQTILCGLLQTGSVLAFDKMMKQGIDTGFASKLIQHGWEVITEALKHGGITHMMDRLSNPAKIKAYRLAEELKQIMRPLFEQHMDDIMSGEFSYGMMSDWKENDIKLLTWRAATGKTAFEQSVATEEIIQEQVYFDHAVLLVAFVKSGVELAYETMVDAGIKEESAYYESLHELPLIANTVARKKLYEMNRIISDTAEYGCYLFDYACRPLLVDFMAKVDTKVIGQNYNEYVDKTVDNEELIEINETIRNHPIEAVGKELRSSMTTMAALV